MYMRPLAVLALLSLLAACGGPRLVKDEWSPGVTKRQGQTLSGKQQGAWSYFYSNGARQAAGSWESDFQDGVWRWWYANGQLQQEGAYRAKEADGKVLNGKRHSAGIREGLWRFWNDDGSLASEGRYLNDRQEGAWIYYTKGNGVGTQRFGDVSEAPTPMPTGIRFASGVFSAGIKDLVWTWWHPNGSQRQVGAFSLGLKVGPWTTWNPDGSIKLAEEFAPPAGFTVLDERRTPQPRWGMLRNGKPDGVWQAWGTAGAFLAAARRGGNEERWQIAGTDGQQVISGATSGDKRVGIWQFFDASGLMAEELGEGDAGRFVRGGQSFDPAAMWARINQGMAILRAPPRPSEVVQVVPAPAPAPKPEPAAPVPVPEPAAQPPVIKPVEAPPATPVVAKAAEPELTIPPADEPSLSPSPVQPAVWTTGQEANAALLVRRYTTGETELMVGYDDGSFGGTSTADRQKLDLLGKPLPATRFLAADGKVVDLKERSGKRPAVLVFLRGFSGQVCLYCAAQTSALSNAMPRFVDKGIDVYLVYPGPVDAVPAFIQAVRSLRKEPPPMPVFLDVSLLAVRALGIEDNLSKPTSLIIDPAGQVRWAYVGKTIADRPAVSDLLREAGKYVK